MTMNMMQMKMKMKMKNINFLIKIIKKTMDFERQDGRGAAGLRKASIFLLKSLRKLSILSARTAGERPGLEKHRFSY